MPEAKFASLTIAEKIQTLYKEGQFVVAIRYYGYKVNLYLWCGIYYEVFYHHKQDLIEKIEKLDYSHKRMKFYEDQIKLIDLSKTQ